MGAKAYMQGTPTKSLKPGGTCITDCEGSSSSSSSKLSSTLSWLKFATRICYKALVNLLF